MLNQKRHDEIVTKIQEELRTISQEDLVNYYFDRRYEELLIYTDISSEFIPYVTPGGKL